MVSGSHVLAQREGAGPLAMIGVVTPGGHNPARPADFFKVHIQRQTLAGLRCSFFIAVVQGAGCAGGRA